MRPAVDVEERLERLEEGLEELSQAIARLEKRLSSVGSVSAEPEPETAFPAAGLRESALELPRQGAMLNWLTQIGRSCLVLGGAFLVRALTDSGTVPLAIGAGLGLAYAILWILLADRAAGRGNGLSGVFLGVTAVVIAYPLIAETTTRFKVFAPSGAAAVLAGLTALCLAVGWRRNLPVLAWLSVLAATATALVLSLVTNAVEPLAAALLAIGLATAWLAYGRRQWNGLRWPAAVAADLMVLWAALRLAPSEPSAPGSAPPLSLFLTLAFALPFLYMGTFAVRTLAGRRDVTAFDVAQSIAALAVGFGGAALVVRNVQDAQPALGASAVGIAVGCYIVAFVFVERRQGHGRNFSFYATLALLLMLSGSALMIRGAFLGYFWCALALAAAVLSRLTRVGLALHSTAYTAAAVWQSGLLKASVDSFVVPVAQRWTPFTGAALCAVAAAVACYVLLAQEENANRRGERVSRLVLAVIVALGLAGLAVAESRDLGGTVFGADPGGIAAVRTAVLAVAAFAFAAARQRTVFPEPGWLAYGLLIAGAAKLLLEDLPSGRPATRFLGFAFYGTALLVVPRVLRGALTARPRAPGPVAKTR